MVAPHGSGVIGIFQLEVKRLFEEADGLFLFVDCPIIYGNAMLDPCLESSVATLLGNGIASRYWSMACKCWPSPHRHAANATLASPSSRRSPAFFAISIASNPNSLPFSGFVPKMISLSLVRSLIRCFSDWLFDKAFCRESTSWGAGGCANRCKVEHCVIAIRMKMYVNR